VNAGPRGSATTLVVVDVEPRARSRGRVPVGRRSGRRRAALAAVLAVALGALASCADRGPSAEVDDGTDSARTERVAPVFPEDGTVPEVLLVQGLVFDLTNRPVDLDYWAAPSDQAECAAEAIVTALGAERLSELGYRPGVTGASLNDIDLADDEREEVADAVEGCVDMAEAVAAMFYGDGRIAPTVANCLADGLDDKQQLRPFVVAVVFGTAVDPFADDGALANAMLDQSVVCVPEGAFNWSDLDLPDDSPVFDADSPGGVSGSPYVDDQRNPTTTTP
jgi:hypothetical protein